MSIPVVADADTLFSATTRGLLIYLDYGGLIRLHWSPLILDEMSRALVDTGRKKTAEQAKAHEVRLQEALPNALVSVMDVQAQLRHVAHAVNSAKDTHVAACAYHLIASDLYPEAAAVVLTSRNIKDFGVEALEQLGIELRLPDRFLCGLFEMKPRLFAAAFRQFRLDLASRPDPTALLQKLSKDGQTQIAGALSAAYSAGVVRL
jgi:hypothetical protein